MVETAGFLSGFARTSVQLMQLAQQNKSLDARIERDREVLKLRNQELKGREAARDLQRQQQLSRARVAQSIIAPRGPTVEAGQREQSLNPQQRIGLLSLEQGNFGQALQAFQPPRQAEEQQGFTLSPGQQRFDPSGEQIAAVPQRDTTQERITETSLAMRAVRGDTEAQAALKLLQSQRKAGATQVNVGPQGQDFGDPPKDMVFGRDAEGNVLTEQDAETGAFRPVAIPIKGSKEDRAIREAATKGKLTKKQARTASDIVTEDINRVVEMINTSDSPVVGPVGGLLARLPGTSAANTRFLLDTIRANIGFDKLQRMRESSPTGGALGQVSERENQLLQATMGSLEQSQTKDQFLFNLRRINDIFLDTIHGPGNGPQRLSGQQPAEEGAAAPGTIGAIDKEIADIDKQLEELRRGRSVPSQ